MDILSYSITALLDLLLLPLGKSHHTASLAWLSVLAGVGMAAVFKASSEQKRIRTAKDRFRAHIFEIRIYQDDLRLVLAALFDTLKANVFYLRLTLRPVLILIVPLVIVFMQLDERFGRKSLRPGETTILSVELKDGVDPFRADSRVTSSSGVTVDAGPLRIPENAEIDWRLRILSSGWHTVRIHFGKSEYEIPVVADEAHRILGHKRRSSSIVEPFLHPGMPPIPGSSPIRSVQVVYPDASYKLLFWRVHWIVAFLFYSFLGALAAKFALKIEI